MKKLVPQKLKNIYHLLNAVLANFWHGFPSRKIKVIGVTGTNGKTTTVQMITKTLEKSGKKVALSSTINFKLGDKEWVNKSKFTTLSAWKIQKFIKDAVDAGCEYIIIETSSHSLDQNRVWGVDYDVAVITNVTREHFDYHGTMEKYRKAKLKLFKKAKIGVVNLDMERPEEFLEVRADEFYGYSTKISNFNPKYSGQISNQAQNSKSEILNKFKIQSRALGTNFKTVIAEDVITSSDKTEFSVSGSNFNLNLIGQFNVENALAAVCVGLSQGMNLKMMAEALAEIKKVPGRMDYVANDLGLKIIIDYALTPDSMEKLGQLVKKMKQNGKVHWVFGSCGQRDRGKRPMMGKIVAKYADYTIVTNEDPYKEDPTQIINEVFSGVVGRKLEKYVPNYQFSISNFQTNSNSKISNSKMVEGVNAWRIMDRKEAIKKAIEMAKAGDIILVTGKGAEETMMIGDRMIPWNDRRVIEKILVEMKK